MYKYDKININFEIVHFNVQVR